MNFNFDVHIYTKTNQNDVICVFIYTMNPLQPTTPTDRPLPDIDPFIWVLNDHPYNTTVMII